MASVLGMTRRLVCHSVNFRWATASISAGLLSAITCSNAYAADCQSLLSAKLPNTTINGAESIPAGTYQPPGSATAFTDLPAFCRVTATVSPVPGSSIGIEVWLPTGTWNGKYQQSGSHGFGGTFYWNEMVPQIQRGYATGITNDGHGGPGGFNVSWAFGDPEAVTDFAYRAVHELAEKAKLLIKAYYGRPQSYAYFNGCSNGGRQGLKSVQIFPADFDGVIIGGAASGFTHAATEQLVVSINLQNSDIQGTSGAAILTLAQNATTAVCHGAVDSVIDDPRRCHWNPFQLVCKPGQDPSTCITTAQASALKANEATLLDPVSGRYVFSGMSPGSEFDQIRFGYEDGLAPFGLATYQLGLNDPTWDSSTFNLHTDLPVLDQALDNINAIESDLTAFKELGGKLIEWHGWDDAAFTPGWTVKYYGQVVEKTGRGELRDVQDFYRLFMMPGDGHCGTGVGPDDIGGEDQTAVSHDPEYDIVSALEAWVEDGVAPLELIATGFNVVDVPSSGIYQQRPICPYPSEGKYKGVGDPLLATSWFCAQAVPPR